ncbi:MAG: cyclic dehypoxanthinyl futalosine synthase [bacterium]|nr:cyclic dehypoxanthinyl futalosine synthase [bacterium]
MALNGERIDFDQAITLFQEKDILKLGKIANAIRARLHPDNVVTYIIDRNINYTNVCLSKCKFCAFYKDVNSRDAYFLSWEELRDKLEETIKSGGTQILMQGGLHPEFKIEYYEEMLQRIKTAFPKIHIHGFSPPEIVHFATKSNLNIKTTFSRLIASGLDSIPGGGAEILVDKIRQQLSPNKCSSAQWLQVMRTAHQLGMKTTATMMFGHIESIADRAQHLLKIRDLQDETGGFTAFIPWTYQPQNTILSGREVGGYEYLKTLAISRIVLHNFKNIQASWVTQGPKIGQIALAFGANDMGSTMLEENVVRAAGAQYRLTTQEIIDLIKDAGLVPRQRDTFYGQV